MTTTTTGQIKRLARRTARANGHRLDAWQSEDGRPTAVCACGGYAYVEGRYWGTGRLPVPGARNMLATCTQAPAGCR